MRHMQVTIDELCAQWWAVNAERFYEIARLDDTDQLELLMDALEIEVTTPDVSWHIAESYKEGDTVMISFARGDY